MIIDPPPLALYVHIPWCVRKCPYCDFNSYPIQGAIPETRFIETVLWDLEQDLPYTGGRPLTSIFIGGGTPSLLSGKAVAHLLEGIRSRCPLVPELEVTLEANPGTVEAGRFASYRAAGVNRLSIGVQSLIPRHLHALRRIHSREEVYDAVASARSAGFVNLNLDLMFGLPDQTLEEAVCDLDEALALGPKQISWYQLTLEPNTPFYQVPPPLPDADLLWEIQARGQATLAARGLMQYEVSAYAHPDWQCRHNLNYWRFGDYLGIGPGAHGKLTHPDGRVYRDWKLDHPAAYLNRHRRVPLRAGRRELEAEDLFEEFLLNALRLREGFPFELFEQRTGLDRQLLARGLERAQVEGLAEVKGEWVRATLAGYNFLNRLLLLFSSS